MFKLKIVVVIVGMRPESQFLDGNGMLLFLGFFFFFLFFVQELFVVQNTADRRICLSSNLNKVKFQGSGNNKRPV